MSGSLWLLTLVVLIPLWLMPGYFAMPTVFANCWTRAPLVVSTDDRFNVDRFVAPAGDNVRPGEKFCMQPLLLSGTASQVDAGSRLRLFNVGERGELFLHEPPLDIVDGRWSTDKVDPGANIREIRFVRVSEAASRRFGDMARGGDRHVSTLPPDARTVASIRLDADPVWGAWDARTCAH